MAEKSSELDRINEPDAVSTTAGASQDSYLATRDSDTSLSNDRLTDGVIDSDETTDETEQIREQIEETRSSMSETIDAIQEKLSISNISEQVKEQVSEHISSAVEAAKDSVYSATIGKVGEFMKTVGKEFSKTDAGKVAKDNPVPLLLIGLGVGLLAYQGMYGSKSRRRTYRYDEYSGGNEIYRGHEDYDYEETEFFGGRTQSNRSTLRAAKGKIGDVAGSAYGTVTDAAGNAYESVSGAASGALDTVSGTASSAYGTVTDAAGNVIGSVGEVAGKTYEKVGEFGSQAREQYDYYIEENPLAVGAVALAVGAAVGLSIPATRYEGQLVGETRDQLLSKAQDAAGDLINRVKEVAGEAQKTLTDEVKNAAGEVQKTVSEQAKSHGLTGENTPAHKPENNPTAKSPGTSPNPIPGTNPKI
jgi:gas vesicle protein